MEDSAVLLGTGIGLLVGLAIGLVVLFVLSLVFRLLWNTTMPDVFALRTITTWQAFKILLIAAMLFGGHRTVVIQPDAVAPETGVSQSAG